MALWSGMPVSPSGAPTGSNASASFSPWRARVLGWGFDQPSAIVRRGDEVVVASWGGSVTEFNVSTGALVRVFSGPRYPLPRPAGLVLKGQDLFVANAENGAGSGRRAQHLDRRG